MSFFDFLFRRNPAPSLDVTVLAPETPPPALASRKVTEAKEWTDAQLKFLSGFLNGSVFEPDVRSYWSEKLGQPTATAVQHLVDAGLLAPASLASKVESAFKATDIKVFLRDRGLPVSGRKADAVARLIAADAPGMEAKVAHITAYICTESGKKLAENYVTREKQRTREARADCFRLVCSEDIRAAWTTVAKYERAQVFPRGLGVDWGHRPSSDDIGLIEDILRARPAILKNVAEADWLPLQRAAAMIELWGERSGKEWLPDEFVGAANLDPDTATRMILFAAKHRASLEQYRRVGCARVEVSGCGEGSCPVCQKINGKKYRVSQVPELPHPACTSKMGCRCMVLPILD